MSNDKITEVGVNIQEKATVIWNIANALFGYFKPHEYGLVILPMTVVKRFHDCLLPTHAAVREQYEKVKKLAVIDGFLTRASGYQFYNTSNAGSQIGSCGWRWSGGSRSRRAKQNCPRMAVIVCLLPLADTSAFCIQFQLVELPLMELINRHLRR